MLLDWLRYRKRNSSTFDTNVDLPALAPADRFAVIGDVHGRLDLVQSLLSEIDGELPLIFVGDYIDRGEYSAQVLHHLKHLSEQSRRQAICLLGNHEEMLLRFLENPEKSCRIWLHNGGIQTLASFGLNVDPEALERPEQIADHLRQAIGEPLLHWLADRQLIWTSGNVSVVHAALDPRKPINKQTRQTCLWGHPQFMRKRRKDGHWVVHGHTIVSDPRVFQRIISIDTGAFATNALTAAEISAGKVEFITTTARGVRRLSA